jgi:NTE family protein
MQALADRVKDMPFFARFDAAALEATLARASWFTLTGGSTLFAQGGPSDQIYFTLAGRLIVARARDGVEETVGYVRSGEPVGEMSFLASEPHSASVYALRDTELLAIERADAEYLLDEVADFASAVARSIVARARRPAATFSKSSPRVFALVSTSPSIDIEQHGRTLLATVKSCGVRAAMISDPETLDADAFDDKEATHDVILLPTRVGDNAAHRFALRHADRFVVFARQDARPPRPFALAPTEDSPARRFRLVDIVMLHEGRITGSVADWVDAADANRVFHVSGPRSEERLARAIAGRTVALVFSGGGARAYAHIGAVQAIRERNIPIDFVCGASMGAIIAACVAMGWKDDEIEARIRDAFVVSNPLGDHVLPVVALTRGRIVEERLKRHFGDVLIEDLEIPFFCVSSELTQGVVRIHMRGRLRDALRATISLPGILPPVVDGERLLVDGAVMNNFPSDIMATLHRGLTIGVDVAQEGMISARSFENPPGFLDWMLHHGLKAPPPIVALLMRTATARQRLRPEEGPADLIIAPKAPGVQLRDWKLYDLAVADGRQSAAAALDANPALLSRFSDPQTPK